MSEPKPFASLSSGLLARKGSAKPAMRPQAYGGGGLEDLGWNDMGHGRAPAGFATDQENVEHVPSSIAALTPAPRSSLPDEPIAEPPVIEQQRSIAASFTAGSDVEESDEAEMVAAEAEPESPVEVEAPAVIQTRAPVVPLPRRPRRAPGLKDKAAFTLRLDPERHLKLRLACAVTHRSAQQIVTEALERFLKTLPELDALAQQLPAKAGKTN